MNSEGMANFIRELRKSKGMTQRQLAEKLNITDKAVSKWERGLGYPDISILSSLAESLGVTVTELLNGEKSANEHLETNAIVETTLQYADKVTFNQKESVKLIGKVVFTVICLLAIFICMISDMAISSRLTWSLYPVAAISFLWLIIIPLFHFKKNNVCMSLASVSVFNIPFLFILNKIIGGTKFMLTLGIPVSLIVIAYMWVIYFLFSIKKPVKWNSAAISILLGVPVSLIINYIVSQFTKQQIINVWDILSCGILGLVSVVLFVLGIKSKGMVSPVARAGQRRE